MEYKCEICHKVFDSGLKLGGHKSSHNRKPGMRGGTLKTSNCKNCFLEITDKYLRSFCSLKCNGEYISKSSKETRNKKIRFNKTIEFLELYKLENNTCEICGKKETMKSERTLAFDHDHETNNFRGMLCFSCNVKFDWFCMNKNSIENYFAKDLP